MATFRAKTLRRNLVETQHCCMIRLEDRLTRSKQKFLSIFLFSKQRILLYQAFRQRVETFPFVRQGQW